LSASVTKHRRLIFCDDFELCVLRSRAQKRRYRGGKAIEKANHDNYWISLRVLHRKRPGSAFTTQRHAKALTDLVDQAFLAAENSEVDPWFRFPLWKPMKCQGTPVIPRQYPSIWPQLVTHPEFLEENYETQALSLRLDRKSEKFHLECHWETHA